MKEWRRLHLIEPVSKGLASVAPGSEVHDQTLVELLANGVEGLFRAEIHHQYARWHRESTTDGSIPFVCCRSSEDELQLAGLTYFDFDGSMFPFRAEFHLDRSPNQTAVTVFVGQVDEETGSPPRLPSSSVILAVRSGDHVSSVELIAGRRQVPITWTKVIRWTSR